MKNKLGYLFLILLFMAKVGLANPTQNEIIFTDIRGSQTLGLITNDSNNYVVNARMDPVTLGLIVAGGSADNTTNSTQKLPILAGRANASAPTWTEGFQVPFSFDLSGNARVTCTNCGNGSGGTSIADQGSFTRNSTSVNAIGVYRPVTVTTTTLSTGTVGVALGNQYGILLSDPYNSSGSELFTTTTTGVISGALTNNGAAPAATSNVGVLPSVANAAPPSLTEGRQTLLSTDLNGILRTGLINGTNASLKSAVVSVASATNTSVVASVASKRVKVMAFTCGSTGTEKISFTDANGGTTIWVVNIVAGASVQYMQSLSTSYPSFLFATSAGNALYITTSSSNQTDCSVTYWTDDTN